MGMAGMAMAKTKNKKTMGEKTPLALHCKCAL
jgi:hypothetical protein